MRGNVLVVVNPEGKLLRVTVGIADVFDSWAATFMTMLLLGISSSEFGVTVNERAAGLGAGPGPIDEPPPPQETIRRETMINTTSRCRDTERPSLRPRIGHRLGKQLGVVPSRLDWDCLPISMLDFLSCLTATTARSLSSTFCDASPSVLRRSTDNKRIWGKQNMDGVGLFPRSPKIQHRKFVSL